ncbi:ATP-dependent zinc metalloprotease FtsH, partial [Alistipes putredinis]
MSENTNNKPKINMPRFNLSWLYVIIAMSFAILYFSNQEGGIDKQITYTEFKDMINKGYANKIIAYDDNTVEMYIKPEFVKDVFKNDYKKVGRNPALNVEIGSMESLDKFMEKAQEEGHFTGSISYEKKRDYFGALFWNIAPFLLLIGIWMFAMRRMSGGAGAGGANPFNVGKSKAQVYEKGDKTNRITFKDVAGQAEAKQEVEEIVEFLKQPQKYTELGGKIPKGALLVGPPGTGKTLLAKAVAGEADVPFFSLSGSDFVEMFVGVGASRVRDLFRQAKEKAPCIIFIDEIDAVGRARGKNPSMGGNDERENTLNQLLTEMDGFGSNSGVIILAATNRADILDKALLRAGRFDRQIHVDLPDLNERKEVFGVHLKPLKLDESVDLDLLARQTPGFSGADIANVCNEAALIAARHGKNAVGKQDFLDAVDRIIGGLEKKTKIMTAEEKRTIALHEAGHATLSWFLEHANPLIKVTIVPRGRALGAAWYLPEERQITTKEQMLDEMCATLGGRAAEELFTGHISTGAMNDLERVTKQSYGMIAYAGMSEKLPNLCYYSNDEYSFSKPYSERTAELIDEEVKRMINEQYDRAKAILSEHKDGHNELARLLVEKEVIFAEDVERIFGKRPWTSRSEEIMALEATAKPVEVTEDFEEEYEPYIKKKNELLPKPVKCQPAFYIITQTLHITQSSMSFITMIN